MTETFAGSMVRTPASGRRRSRAHCPAIVVCDDRHISLGHLIGLAVRDDSPAVEQERPVAEGGNRPWIVADNEDRSAGCAQLPVPFLASHLEAGVAHREYLVEHENLADRLEGD